MAETWCEKCEKCGVLCGGKEFTDENEFDEHPDRKIGYNEDNEWFCSACREKVMEYVIKCCDGSGCNECLSSDEEEEEEEEEEEDEESEDEEEEYIIFNCARCDVGIVNNSRDHDNCITNDGKKWWCLECSSAMRYNEEKDKWEEEEEEEEESEEE